jgi:hypothetical protein
MGQGKKRSYFDITCELQIRHASTQENLRQTGCFLSCSTILIKK